MFTIDEHRLLTALERNITEVDAFLFKGIKDGPAVGVVPDDLYSLETSRKKTNKA